MQQNITISIAEDHQILREQLASFLDSHDNFQVKFTSKNGKELIDQLSKGIVDVIILDLDMPIMDGRKALNYIRKKYGNRIKIIILSMHEGILFVKKYINAGANAYLNKGCSSQTLVEAIQSVFIEGKYFSKEFPESSISGIRIQGGAHNSALEGEPLTEKEIDICRLVCKGYSCPKIANTLNLSIRTVENHKSHIFKKFNVKSCTEMMEKAILAGYYNIKI